MSTGLPVPVPVALSVALDPAAPAGSTVEVAAVARVGERELAFMRQALAAAESAAGRGEVPVGAVVVVAGQPIAIAHNERETANDPTAHAEVVALRRAASALGSWRLTDAELYVTMEPCPMCAGAIVNARIRRLFYGCHDPKAGAVRSLYQILDDRRLNHRVEVIPEVLGSDAAALLRTFFGRLRR